MRNDRECIIIFTKFPVPGKVKTRLAPTLTKLQACGLYKNMVEATLQKARKTGKEVFVCYYPATSRFDFMKWLGKGIKYIPQEGSGLGSKMKNAFLGAFGAGYERAAIVGCDIPELTVKILCTAFRGLKNKGSAIGPAADGGYYLIGFDREYFLADVFNGIRWGGPSVFEDTLKIIKKSGHKAAILPELKDLDTISDIASFAGRKFRNSGVSRLISRILKKTYPKVETGQVSMEYRH